MLFGVFCLFVNYYIYITFTKNTCNLQKCIIEWYYQKTEGGYIMKLFKKLYKKRYIMHRLVIMAGGAYMVYVLTGDVVTLKQALLIIFFATYDVLYAFFGA